MTLVPLGRADGRSRWTVEHDGRSYAVFVHEGTVRVCDARCPHRGGPLAEGWLRNGAVICPWHWYAFELDSGRCRTTPQLALRTYHVVERDGELYAEIVEDKPRSWSEMLRAHAQGR